MDTSAVFSKPDSTPERQAFYDRLDGKSVAPLWEVLARIIPAHPTPDTVPVLFRYEEVRPLLIEPFQKGHSSIKVTFDLYGHLMPGAEAAGLLDAYLARADTDARKQPSSR